MKLSVLDQSTAADGVPAAQTLRDTVELAVFAEELGYHRFWVSEHHNHPAINGTAPEILMAAISQRTSRIRLGSAGVMLPHYAPLKVAEQFRVLESLAPGRIDLGLGRAPGGDGLTSMALNPNAHEDANNFPSNVRDLMAWVSGDPLPSSHPFKSIVAHPETNTAPEIWMLGTSDYGASVAAHFGIPYCFAHFITDGQGVKQALTLYRDNYQPSERFPKPHATVCVWALAADTTEEAEVLFSSRAYNKVRRSLGDLRPIIAPENIDWDSVSESERRHRDRLRAVSLVGDGAKVSGMLRQLGEDLDLDELVVLTWTHSQEARRRSYALLAEHFH